MGRRKWFRAFVERLLTEQFGTAELIVDADGDVPFHSGSSACWVTVEDGGPGLAVRVWGVAAHGLRPTAAVLREVNELNAGAGLAKVALCGDRVQVELRLPADQVTRKSLRRACAHVVGLADDVGALFAVHGGSTPFPVSAQAG